jgi:choline dehydrogenase-like flavoprotein
LDWLDACGATRTWSPPEPPRALSDWFHQAGTCRMSEDPRLGVVDPSGRVHGHDNLFVADGSVHVTNGGFNPALTIFALALRTADQALGQL